MTQSTIPKSLTLLIVFFLCFAHAAGQTTPLNSGWLPFEQGFTDAPGQGESGGPAMACENITTTELRGATYALHLNQQQTYPILLSGWSRAETVSGTPDDGYSIYVDLTYMDGGHQWGLIAPFTCGTHSWEQRQVRILPTKPIKDAQIYVLLRGHQGKCWFSDISVTIYPTGSSFDSQVFTGKLPTKAGWYVRDVAADSALVPAQTLSSIGLSATSSWNGDRNSILLTNKRTTDRALTIYYCLPINVVGGTWWNTIRSSQTIADSECANVVSVPSGAVGLTSRYPFAMVAKGKVGEMIGVPPSVGPRLVRLFYNPASKLLCAAFDVAITNKNRLHPKSASAEVLLKAVQPDWGMRNAAFQYYNAYPDAFKNRIAKQGIWIPFTDPKTVPHPEDFGIRVHEGDNSVATDQKLGILSFRYSEPMTWWMNMAPEIPRTYASALDELNKALVSSDAKVKKQAGAVVNSGTFAADQTYNLSFQNQPWANGAVWVLNPNPNVDRKGSTANQGDIVFNLQDAIKRYQTTSLSGEYLDSLESHSEVLDYRPESLAASSLEPSFDLYTKVPVIPQAYSTYEITHYISQHLHQMGRLLMANTTPMTYFGYMPMLDCAGIEVNWMSNGIWSPEDDDTLSLRRTMSYHKLYMLLQNTDFSLFGSPEVAKYFDRCLFYGVFPSFFSADAATHVYWENAQLYERDRPIFKKIIPILNRIAEAGWEPITLAHSSRDDVYVERFGDHYWTVMNVGTVSESFDLRFDRVTTVKSVLELKSQQKFPIHGNAVTLSLEPGECKVISQ